MVALQISTHEDVYRGRSPQYKLSDGGREFYTSRQTMNRIGDKSSQYKFSKTTNRPGEEQELSAKGPAEVPGK